MLRYDTVEANGLERNNKMISSGLEIEIYD